HCLCCHLLSSLRFDFGLVSHRHSMTTPQLRECVGPPVPQPGENQAKYGTFQVIVLSPKPWLERCRSAAGELDPVALRLEPRGDLHAVVALDLDRAVLHRAP